MVAYVSCMSLFPIYTSKITDAKHQDWKCEPDNVCGKLKVFEIKQILLYECTINVCAVLKKQERLLENENYIGFDRM
jgi:hypothetical protein